LNEPEYILSEVLREVTASASVALTANDAVNFPTAINYQHGYVHELNEMLLQWGKSPAKEPLKFPLVWFAEFNVRETRGSLVWYSECKNIEVFFINKTDKNWKADERDTNNYNPVILPMYREWMKQLFDKRRELDFDQTVTNPQGVKHIKIKAPYWGEQQKTVLTDIVDCLKIEGLELLINNNPNCS